METLSQTSYCLRASVGGDSRPRSRSCCLDNVSQKRRLHRYKPVGLNPHHARSRDIKLGKSLVVALVQLHVHGKLVLQVANDCARLAGKSGTTCSPVDTFCRA